MAKEESESESASASASASADATAHDDDKEESKATASGKAKEAKPKPESGKTPRRRAAAGSSGGSGRNPAVVASMATIAGLWAACQLTTVPYVAHLMTLVTAILYVACHGSLVLREEQALARGERPPRRGRGGDDGDDDDGSDAGSDGDSDDDESSILPGMTETLRKEDAMTFPLLGSASLFTLYLAFKFFDRDTVNLIISVYFSLVGCAALTATFSPVLAAVLGPFFSSSSSSSLERRKQQHHHQQQVEPHRYVKEILIHHPLPAFLGGESPWDWSIDCTAYDVLGFVFSVLFSIVYFKTKHWSLNNVLGIAFCLQGIERFSLGTYKIGAILLVGLFFYDIFWVFGTDVMVTVAKNLDGPIKILFPRSLVPNPETGKIDCSLLGLGDIVIPGFFLALLLRFDAHNANLCPFPTNIHARFHKPYFHSCLVAYILGLGTTLFVMIQFDAAQPALLYLVPACLGSSLLCAAIRGEMKALFEYSEEEEGEEEEGKGKIVAEKDDETKKETVEEKKGEGEGGHKPKEPEAKKKD